MKPKSIVPPLLLTGIALLAFYLRAEWVHNIDIRYYPFGISPEAPSLVGYDGLRYDWIARNLLNGAGYGYTAYAPDAWRPPGYPFFLYIIYKFFGHGYYIVRIIQAIIGTGICLLLYALTEMLTRHNPKGIFIALLAALLYAVNFYSIIMTGVLYSEILTSFFILLSIFLIYLSRRSSDRKASWLLFFGSLCCWYAVLIRPGNIFFCIFVLLWLILNIRRDPKRLVTALAIFVLGFIIIICPWLTRNYMLYKRFVFISTMAGEVFYTANHPISNGEFINDDFRVTQEQKKELEGLDSIEKNGRFYRYGWEEIKSDPKRIAKLIFLKNMKLWFKNHDNYYFYDFLPHSSFPLVKFRLIRLLAAIGFIYLIIAGKLWDFALILGYLISYLFFLSAFYFYNGPRSRIEIVAILCILGSIGLVQFVHGLRALVKALIKQLQGAE